MVDTAIFLGAGASCAERAPSQGKLFADCFSFQEFRTSEEKMDRELAAFVYEMFTLDVKRADIATVNFRRIQCSLTPVRYRTLAACHVQPRSSVFKAKFVLNE